MLTDLQSLEQSPLELEPQGDKKWPNASQVLEKLEELLGVVEDKISDVSDRVEATVEVVLDIVEQAALGAAGKWNETVQQWVDKANEAGVDVQACVQDEKLSLTAVSAALRSDAKACMADRLLQLDAAVENLRDVAPNARVVMDEARAEVARCRQQNNAVTVGVCLASIFPWLQVKAGAVVASAAWLASVAAVKAGAVVPLASLCASRATAGRAAEAAKIVDVSVTCIREKLSN